MTQESFSVSEIRAMLAELKRLPTAHILTLLDENDEQTTIAGILGKLPGLLDAALDQIEEFIKASQHEAQDLKTAAATLRDAVAGIRAESAVLEAENRRLQAFNQGADLVVDNLANQIAKLKDVNAQLRARIGQLEAPIEAIPDDPQEE